MRTGPQFAVVKVHSSMSALSSGATGDAADPVGEDVGVAELGDRPASGEIGWIVVVGFAGVVSRKEVGAA